MTSVVSSRPTRVRQLEKAGYRLCSRCIMDTSDPDIHFLDDGTCNHCNRYAERAESEIFHGDIAASQLASLVDEMKRNGRKRDYDCIIGVSGGVDSTMVAYHVRRLGLRPLALHLDNGWDSELAVNNIHTTLAALDIDLQTHVIDWEEFRDLQLSFLRASVPNCECPTDHAINAFLLKTAARTGIRYVLHGGNVATESIMPLAWSYYNQDLRHLRAIHRRFGSRKLKTLPQISFAGFVSAILLRGVRYIPILNYLDYNKHEAKGVIQNELGWRDYGGKHFESIYTRFFQSYILPRKFGFDKRRAHLSTLVCSGEMSRDEALEEMKAEPYAAADLERDLQYVPKKLGITSGEFEEIMSASPRKYSDYPSNRFLYHDLRTLKAWFKRIATARKSSE